MDHLEVLITIANANTPAAMHGSAEHISNLARTAAQKVDMPYLEVSLKASSANTIESIFKDASKTPVWAFFTDLQLATNKTANKVLELLMETPQEASFMCIVLDPTHRGGQSMPAPIYNKMMHFEVDAAGINVR